METRSADLTGRTAIVTGASRGIGKAVALALAAAGADLVLVSRSIPDLEKTAEGVREYGRRALVIPADVARSEQVDAMVERAVETFGHIDILVNDAAVRRAKPLLETSDEDWLLVINNNLNSMVWCARAVGRHMVSRRYGKIINLASTFGIVAVANNTAYCVAKGGVVQLTKGLALEWARHGIRVNAIAPGVVRTPISAQRLADPAYHEAVVRNIPLKRPAEPEDIAPLAVYLASDASDFMTGSVMLIDGGQLAGYDHWGP